MSFEEAIDLIKMVGCEIYNVRKGAWRHCGPVKEWRECCADSEFITPDSKVRGIKVLKTYADIELEA